MTSDEDRIAALERELAELKAKVSASVPKSQSSWEEQERAVAEYRDKVHKMREENASHIPNWMHHAVGVGVSNYDAWDLAHHGAVQSPSQTRMGTQVIDVPEVRTDQGGRPRPLAPASDAAIDREVAWRLAQKARG